MEFKSEVNNFIKICLTIFISVSYCYTIGQRVPKGTKRLILTLPTVSLYLYLPLRLSSINLGVTISFLITWLGSSKLLLFSLGKGPLSLQGPPPPSSSSSSQPISFVQFILITCLPIEVKPKNPPQKTLPKSSLKHFPFKCFSIKLLILATLFHLFTHKEKVHPMVISLLRWPLVYLIVETILAGLACSARAVLRAELEPQFNEPYMSTSLEDFWLRRYNLPVSHILRQTVHDPILSLSTRYVGPRWAVIPAIMGSFLSNGLVHELIYFYVGRRWPTWGATWFFILHGSLVAVEIFLKEALDVDTWRIPRLMSVALTNGFVALTMAWLFFPPLIRSDFDARLFGEYEALGGFLKSIYDQMLSFSR